MATSLVAELAEKLSSATNNFDIDESTIFVNTSADTVGIGTDTPASKLDVRGTMQVGEDDLGHDVRFFGASAGAQLWWDESEDTLYLRGATADHATDSAGRIVLATNQAAVADGDRIGQIDFQASGETGLDAVTVSASIWAEADDTFAADNNSTDLVFATGASELATEKVRITSDGKVGIGTSAPTGLLQIAQSGTHNRVHFDTFSTTDAEFTSLCLRKSSSASIGTFSTTSDGEQLGEIIFQGVDNGSNADVGAGIQVVQVGSAGYRTPCSMTFITSSTNAVNADVLVLDESGNVGIGTTSPSGKLDVEGDANSSLTTFLTNDTRTSDGTSDVSIEIVPVARGSSTNYFNKVWIKGLAHTANGGRLAFYTRDSSNVEQERMRIDESGKITLGQNSSPTLDTVLKEEWGWQWKKIAEDVTVAAAAYAGGTATLVTDFFDDHQGKAGFIIARGTSSGSHTQTCCKYAFAVSAFSTTVSLTEVWEVGAEHAGIGGSNSLSNSSGDLVVAVDWTGGPAATTGTVDAWVMIIPN